VLVLARFAFFFGLLVFELAVVQDAADRRDGVGRYLDQVQPRVARSFERLEQRYDAGLAAIFVNEPDLSDTDAVVDTELACDR
jgi:hypothetical protein